MPKRLKRYYGAGHLHFITCSCYQRRPLLGRARVHPERVHRERTRNLFVRILDETRDRYRFSLVGYVAMPDHIHLLMSEPAVGTPSTVMQVLKQRVSRRLRRKRPTLRTAKGGPPTKARQLRLWDDEAPELPRFWQRRFYDFNFWSHKKRKEKLDYMHSNPVKRGLARRPQDWPWSSYAFYAGGAKPLLGIDPV